MRRSRSRSRSSSVETGRSRSKLSKFESLKPVGNYLTSLLTEHGLSSIKSKVVVTDMLDRLVTGGYGWDKMILYHAKVGQGSAHSADTHEIVAGRGEVHQETDSLHIYV